MRTFLLSLMAAVVSSCVFSAISFASCTEGPPNTFTCIEMTNPDPNGIQQGGNDNNLTANMLPNSAIDTNNLNGIHFGDGNNVVNVTNASIQASSDAISLGNGNNTINLLEASLVGINSDGISTNSGGANIVNVDQSSVFGGFDGITISGSEPSTITMTNSNVVGEISDGLCLTGGPDVVTIEQSILSGLLGSSIFFGSGDDTVTLKTGADVRGDIQCSSGDDTIIFAMMVPTNQLELITSEIESKNPAGDSIFINGLFYEWENCEELIADLKGGFVTPVPTLSEWGLIAMAGLLGIVGFMVVRRRQLSA